jgi:hypothetical protein
MAKRENMAERGARAVAIVERLHTLYPDADCALRHRSAFELLVATILSAQSTDDTVNKVTPHLFEAYPDPQALAAADLADVERIVHPTGFFRQKAKNIVAAADRIVALHGGQVPDDMEALVALPGWLARPPTWCWAPGFNGMRGGGGYPRRSPGPPAEIDLERQGRQGRGPYRAGSAQGHPARGVDVPVARVDPARPAGVQRPQARL